MTHSIRKTNGIAGQIAYDVETETGPLGFVGSVYGGPIVMVTASGSQVFVADPGRFGEKLTAEWIENFLAAD